MDRWASSDGMPRRTSRAARITRLTARQRDVLRLVADGHENKAVAAQLGITEQAVKQQVSVLLRKFGAPNRAALARTVFARRLLGRAPDRDLPIEYLCDRAPILIAITQGPGHAFVLVNQAFVRTFGDRGYTGRTVAECFPELAGDRLAALDHVYREGVRRIRDRHRLRVVTGGVTREVELMLVLEPTRADSGEVEGIVMYGWELRGTREPSAAVAADPPDLRAAVGRTLHSPGAAPAE